MLKAGAESVKDWRVALDLYDLDPAAKCFSTGLLCSGTE